MKKIKIGIAITIITIISLIITILLINNESESDKKLNILNDYNYSNPITEIEDEIKLTPEEMEGESQQGSVVEPEKYEAIKEKDYVTLEKCIVTFLSKINKNSSIYYGSGGQKVISDEEIQDGILKILSENYISKNNITIDNVDNYIYNLDKRVYFIPTEIRKFYKLDQVNSFVIEGLLETREYTPIMKILLILNMDIKNNTYSIEILDSNQDINYIMPEKLTEIEENYNNSYQYLLYEDKDIINQIVSLYQKTILGYPEVFYNNYLNNEYKQQRFKSLEEFKNYVEKNKDLIQKISIERYKKIENNDSIIYIVEDRYGNKMVIFYKSILNYNMYLDQYTKEIEFFKELYDNSNNNTKVGLQINKLKQMINLKDYNSIYNKFNTVFKSNNFSNVSDLETYLKNNFYAINEIDINSVQENDDYYICDCELINLENENESKNMNIIIKLIDSNNFEMSFSIE